MILDMKTFSSLSELRSSLDCAEQFKEIYRLAREMQFDLVAYERVTRFPFNRPQFTIVGNYPSQWPRAYQLGHWGNIDPRIRLSRESDEIIIWKEALFDCYESKKIWRKMQSFGLGNGITQPLSRQGDAVEIISLSRYKKVVCSDEVISIEKSLERMRSIAKSFAALLQVTKSDHAQLTDRETEVLRWVADGKTSTEISIILNLAVVSINFHIKNIQRKLNTSNRCNTIAYAVAAQLI